MWAWKMIIQNLIEQKLVDSISLVGLEVINESHMHNVPSGSESHFKVVIISDDFEGERLIRRHQRVNKILADELENILIDSKRNGFKELKGILKISTSRGTVLKISYC